jgi:hypothetical protein
MTNTVQNEQKSTTPTSAGADSIGMGRKTSQINTKKKEIKHKTRWILSTTRLTCKCSETPLSSRRTVLNTPSKKNPEPDIPRSHNHHGNMSNLKKKILNTDLDPALRFDLLS